MSNVHISFSASNVEDLAKKIRTTLENIDALVQPEKGETVEYSANISVGCYNPSLHNLAAPGAVGTTTSLPPETPPAEPKGEKPKATRGKAKGKPEKEVPEDIEPGPTDEQEDDDWNSDDTKPEEPKPISKDELVAALNKLANTHPDKAKAVKRLLGEYTPGGSAKLSDVSPGDYTAVYNAANEMIGG